MQYSNTKNTATVALADPSKFVFASASYAHFGNLLKNAVDRAKKPGGEGSCKIAAIRSQTAAGHRCTSVNLQAV
jgi:hypothetical protein